MKRHASQLSLILAALAFAPVALAGSEIVKCVDSAGHVTLTDQPCSGNAVTVRLAPAPASPAADESARDITEPEADSALAAAPQAGAVERDPVGRDPVERHTTRALLRQANWKTPPAPRSRPLARDVATLKEARLQMMMLDSAAKRQPRLAGLR
jgi:hypothetical protein